MSASIAPKARGPRRLFVRARNRARGLSQLEFLETRRLLSTITWDGGSNGQGIFWADAVNWVGDVLPGPNDDALIPIVGPGVVSIQDPVSVRSVSSSAILSVDGIDHSGSLGVSVASSVASLLLSGELQGAGDITITGLLNWSAGAMRGTGHTILPGLAIGTVSTASGVSLLRRLDNSGKFTIDSGNMAMSFGGSQPGTLNNLPGATFEIGGATTIASQAAAAAINNSGTWLKSNNNTASINGVAVTNTSMLTVQGGILAFDSSLTLTNGGGIGVSSGATLTAGAIEGVSGAINVNAGGTMISNRLRQSSLTAAGVATLRVNGSDSNVSILQQLSASGQLDLNDNDLIVDYPNGGPSPMSQIRSWIVSGRANGAWTGPGLTSSAARTHPSHATTLGLLEATSFKQMRGSGTPFDGQAIDNSSVLIKYTWSGDTDFTGKVDGADYARIDVAFNNQVAQGNIGGWQNGDTDLNNKIDGADYALIDAAFNAQQGTILRPGGGDDDGETGGTDIEI